MTSHYLRTEGWTWEYQETDRKTGRPKRKSFEVPRYIDILDPGDWTNKWGNKDNEDGEVVVCHKGKGEKDDIVFFGDPTPDMMPQDDEARAISASFEEHWKYKPEQAEVSHSQSMIDNFQVAMAEAQAKPQQVEIAGLAELVAIMAQSQQQTAEMMKTLVHRKL
jgi:hypothetical protein